MNGPSSSTSQLKGMINFASVQTCTHRTVTHILTHNYFLSLADILEKHNNSGRKGQKRIGELFGKPAKTAKTNGDNTNASASISSAEIPSARNDTEVSALADTSVIFSKADPSFLLSSLIYHILTSS